MLFIIACGAIVFGLLTLVNKERDAKEKLPLDAPPRPSATVTPILPEDDPAPSKPETVGQPSPAMPFATSDLPSLSNTVPGQAAAEESQSPGVAALKVLETFLAATTLAERLPIIETKTALVDLASSCLVRPLPSAAGIATDAQESNAVERSVDIFYHVDFQTGSTTDLQTLLVRTRGTGSPKVVIDPFLDLYGGRLAAYASAPSEATGTFQAIVSAGAFCYEETIPNREKKLTLKLLARESVKEITKAYFGKQSRIGMMLEDENSGLRYGQARACTLVLRWNTEENPAMPYLEAIDVKTLDWNP